jgi:hypothetical protein
MKVRGTGVVDKHGPSISRHPLVDSHASANTQPSAAKQASDRCMTIIFRRYE